MITKSEEKQKTIKSPFSVKGKGLHTGREAEVTVKPAPSGTGITFKRVDEKEGEWNRAVFANLQKSDVQGRQTSVAGISTVEHLMAAFYGLGVDNAYIEVKGPELPGLDGSSKEYCDAIGKVGLEAQEVNREYFKVKEPLYVDFKKASIVVLPSEEFKISYTLSFPGDSLGDEFFEAIINEESFAKEIAPARTFILKEEAEALMTKGYGKGAHFNNTLVFDKNKPMNNELRFPMEAARHKVLDILGDLYMLGCRIKGHVIATRTGHTHNLQLVSELQKKLTGSTAQSTDTEHLTAKELNINHIKKILPHRYPFLFVDKVTIIEEGKKAVGIKNVSLNDYFFQGHFPGHPVMPGVIIVEALAQAAGVVLLRRPKNAGKLAYFMSIDKIKFRQPVVPGDQLKLNVEISKDKLKTAECIGKAYVGEKIVCEAILRFAIVSQ